MGGGKTSEGYSFASKSIRERDVVKDYVALVYGSMPAFVGACDAPIDNSLYNKTRTVTISEKGATAVTMWEVMAEYESTELEKHLRRRYSLVHCRIITGRTHQIRVHLAHLGHPLVSDWQYCDDRELLLRDDKLCRRIFLHKVRVAFVDM